MPASSCPRCGRAYTAGEVTGLGILRPRPEARGGPWIEFPCPGCRNVLRLMPHGNARYAVPGEPPPPEPDVVERRVPWGAREGEDGSRPPRPATASVPTPANPSPAPRPPPPPAPTPPPAGAPPVRASAPPAAGSAAPREPAEAGEAPLDFASAERLLRLLPGYTAADVERAFRRRALLCHPDKVSHLDEDFQALAARKFKRLKEARDLLGGA